jgi:hypothetical protein
MYWRKNKDVPSASSQLLQKSGAMLALILVRSTICTPVIRGVEHDSYGKYDFAICVTNISFVHIKIFQLHDLAMDAGSKIVR